MYVCLCNALTDRQVKQVVASAAATTTASIYAACGCRAQCGQCAKALLNLLRTAALPDPELQGAD
ncbi:MAG: (2Fe-2S)-binding protein [Acetobacteraceae bacterium]|nr:(2Fe-2S)-binding protein [Pseudomonadota bacterium]